MLLRLWPDRSGALAAFLAAFVTRFGVLFFLSAAFDGLFADRCRGTTGSASINSGSTSSTFTATSFYCWFGASVTACFDKARSS
jgi:hypothetical protein